MHVSGIITASYVNEYHCFCKIKFNLHKPCYFFTYFSLGKFTATEEKPPLSYSFKSIIAVKIFKKWCT